MEADDNRSQLIAAVVRLAGGDRTALQIIYQETSAKLFGICVRILNDKSEAEDVLQEVYLTIWRKAASFDPARASPITWLVTIARNRAIDRLRATAGGRRLEPIAATESGRDQRPASQQSNRLALCLGELESRQAVAIRSAFLDGNTYEELALRMRVPLGTMKSWIRRGLMKLKDCLER